jgi:O-antigen/teichoic acid export membrane protein
MDFINEEKEDIKNVFTRIKKRDFSGTTGQAIKNSSYQLARNLIFKFGSLLFTIIIARILLPELFGLYSLALSTILLFAAFSDLGINSALITYGARALGKKNLSKAKAYSKKLFKWKLNLIILSSLILLASAYFISEIYYSKPIFYALLAGGLYLPIIRITGFINQLFKTTENFKTPMIQEIIFQVTRFTIVPLTIIFFLNSKFSTQFLIFAIFISISLSHLVSLLFLSYQSKKNLKFLKAKKENLNKTEIKNLKKFIYPLSATAMAGMFFGFIDILMLGHFVDSEFISYYGAAFSLVGGASAIIGFMSISLMPILAKNSGKVLEKIFKKTKSFIILISISAGIFTYLLAGLIVKLAYGIEYSPAIQILQAFSVLVILLPIIGIYVSYYTVQKKTKTLAWLIISSAILNILFNYFAISYGLENYGQLGAVFAAVFATIASRILYLGGLVSFRRNLN